jgi:hypothetical protein
MESLEGLLKQYKNDQGLDHVLDKIMTRIHVMEVKQTEFLQMQQELAKRANAPDLSGVSLNNSKELSELKEQNRILVKTIANMEEQIDTLENQINNVTYCIQGYVVQEDAVHQAESSMNIIKRQKRIAPLTTSVPDLKRPPSSGSLSSGSQRSRPVTAKSSRPMTAESVVLEGIDGKNTYVLINN